MSVHTTMQFIQFKLTKLVSLCASPGTKFPFIMKLCFSSSKNMNSAWNNETSEIMDGGELLN